MRKLPTLAGAGIVLAGILAAPLSAAVAGATPGIPPVGPNQSFVGLVNGHSSDATIDVLCPGPLRINQRGHPVAGQTVGVATPVAASTAVSFGYTGSAAHAIGVAFTPAASSAAVGNVVFTQYGDQPLPTTLLLPCYGTRTVLFVPRPSSNTARPAQVSVTFEATCGSTVCPVVTKKPHRH